MRKNFLKDLNLSFKLENYLASKFYYFSKFYIRFKKVAVTWLEENLGSNIKNMKYK